jgi:AraC family transcriptional regulator
MDKRTGGGYQGDFVAWSGVCGFIGAGGGSAAIAPHSHYSIQLAIGFPDGLRVRLGPDGEWQSCTAALVPSRATHTIDVSECEMSTVLFIEPETPEGRALAARLHGGAELLDPEFASVAAQRLERAWRGQGSPEAVQAACMQLVHQLSGTAHREATDARVLAAIEFIRQRVDQPVSLREVAQAAHLSPERFRHLFVQETGMPLRTYVLWRRLLHVWTLLMSGESLSAAAHSAGFADSAHLSRTSRTMFGIPPSLLQMTGPLSAQSRRPSHRP